ncbi:MAG: transcription antitermination factor NusB, partial [Acidimicrobiia bacterium]|nr:transcription antitermination factor NusB [Acidimicrobiia bacterium]
VVEEAESLDEMIETTSRGWRVNRMPAVDRNVLRIAVWELKNTDTPTGVVISEAVRMAKEFSTERSGSFVNGVLATLTTSIRGDTETPDSTASVASRTDL